MVSILFCLFLNNHIYRNDLVSLLRMISFRHGHRCSKLNTFNVFCHIKDCNFTTSDPKPRLCLQSFVAPTQSVNSFVLYQAFLASLSVHGRLEHRISTTNCRVLLLLFMWFLEVKPKVVFQTFKVILIWFWAILEIFAAKPIPTTLHPCIWL